MYMANRIRGSAAFNIDLPPRITFAEQVSGLTNRHAVTPTHSGA